MCCSGTLLPSAKAYKAWVGRIFLQCGSKSQKLFTSFAKNKVVRVLRPQSGQTACRLGFVPPPCVVVVHSCLQLRLIRHEWGASFFEVGASLKNYSHRLQRTKPWKSFDPKANKLLVGLDSFLPHNYNFNEFVLIYSLYFVCYYLFRGRLKKLILVL